jgi:hypothetical protein
MASGAEAVWTYHQGDRGGDLCLNAAAAAGTRGIGLM